MGRFCCYRWSTLMNYNKCFCNGAFFEWIEWLKVFVLNFYFYLIICKSNISRFWMCYVWEFIIFDARNIFLEHQGSTGTILVPVEIELVPLIGLLPSPRTGYRNLVFCMRVWNCAYPCGAELIGMSEARANAQDAVLCVCKWICCMLQGMGL